MGVFSNEERYGCVGAFSAEGARMLFPRPVVAPPKRRLRWIVRAVGAILATVITGRFLPPLLKWIAACLAEEQLRAMIFGS